MKLEILEPRLLLSTSAGPVVTAPPITATPIVSPAQSSGITPQQMCAAYGINLIVQGSIVGNGAGQTIAIVDPYDDPDLVSSTSPAFAASDLAQFDAYWTANGYDLPNPPSFTKLGQSGGTSYPATDPTGGWEMEEALDVEWAHVIAPDASIVLVEAADDTVANLITAVNTARNLPGTSVVSMSWGDNEYSGEKAYDKDFTTPAGHKGITFVAAAGDTSSVMYPASSPNIVAVGGTELTVDSSGDYEGEIAWNYGGGGPSTKETEPTYQLGVQTSGSRETPDVAFDAGTAVSIYDRFDNSSPWQATIGTSLATPCWAALIAIADQLRAPQGLGSLDGPSQTLPALYSLSSSDFHDITSGSNGVHSAGPGYDMVTGIGSPVANLLVPDLADFVSSAPAQLVFTTQPADGTAGQTLASVQVTIENQYGSVAKRDDSIVTLSLSGGTLSGTTSVAAVNGVATFKSLSVTTAGSHALSASDSKDGLRGFDSADFGIAPAAAAQLAFTDQPQNGIVGQSLAAVEVSVEDRYGNVETADDSLVTLADDRGTLTGTWTIAAVSGVAEFSDLSAPAGSDGIHTLTATDDSLTPATSAYFAVTTLNIAGTWNWAGAFSTGTFTLDDLGDVTGSILNNDGTSLTLTSGSYAVSGQGNVVFRCEDEHGNPYTWSGSLNAAQDVITLAQTSFSGESTGQSVMVLSGAGPFSNADISGSWGFASGDGTYGSLTFDGNGDVTSGNEVWGSTNDTGAILSGSNYSVSTDGLVTITLYFQNSPGGKQTSALIEGALNASQDFFAGDKSVEASNPTAPTLFTMTKHTATFGLSDLSGPWNITADEMTGSLIFNGAGKILPSAYSNASGTYSLSGTYTVSATGWVTANVATDQPGDTTMKLTGYLDSAMDTLAMDQLINNTSDVDVFNILTNPSATNLVASVAGGTLLKLNPAIPGDKGSVSVVVTNAGQIPAAGSATINLYLCDSTSETTGGTLLGALTKQTLNLAYDKAMTYTFSSIQLPANLPYGTYYLRADVTATLTNPAENPASFSAFSSAVPVAWEFGNVGPRKGLVLNLTAADGTVGIFSLSTAGTGDVTVQGGQWDLGVTGSAATSALTITTTKSTKSASGQISLDDITVAGPLATFSGPGVNLTGAMSASGAVTTLTLNNLSNDGGITLGGAPTGKTTLTFDEVEDESLTCGNTISSLTAASWQDSDDDGDTITAPALTTATIKKGNLAANLEITGGIGALSITGGNLSGNISAASAGTVSVTGGDLSGSLDISGSLKSLSLIKVAGNGGDISAGAGVTAGTIGTMSVGGSMEGATGDGIVVMAGAITKSVSVAGTMDYTQVLSRGNITSLALGAMDNSDVFAGVSSAGLPAAAADFSSQDSIGTFTITGGSATAASFSNSNIAAWTLGTLNLGYPDDSANGVACDAYATLSYRVGTVTRSWKKSDPTASLPGSGVVRIIAG